MVQDMHPGVRQVTECHYMDSNRVLRSLFNEQNGAKAIKIGYGADHLLNTMMSEVGYLVEPPMFEQNHALPQKTEKYK